MRSPPIDTCLRNRYNRGTGTRAPVPDLERIRLPLVHTPMHPLTRRSTGWRQRRRIYDRTRCWCVCLPVVRTLLGGGSAGLSLACAHHKILDIPFLAWPSRPSAQSQLLIAWSLPGSLPHRFSRLSSRPITWVSSWSSCARACVRGQEPTRSGKHAMMCCCCA